MYQFKSFLISVLTCGLVIFSAAHAGEESPLSVEGATTVDTAKAKQLFEDEVLFVDVRKDSDWEAGRVPGALHLNIKTVFSEETLLEEISKDEAVVMYCNGAKCLRSADASEKAVAWGFTNVYYYREGFPGWTSAGMPVE